MNIKTTGTLLSEFSKLEGELQAYSCNAEEDLIVEGSTKSPFIIFSRNHSNILVTLGKKQYPLSPNNFLIIKQGNFKIEKHTPSWQVTVLCPSANLISKASTIFKFDHEMLKDILETTQVLPRKTWMNEIFHRFYFAKSVERIDENYAIQFLELEILKEVYYTYLGTVDTEQRDIFPIEDQLIKKFPPKLEDSITYIETHLFSNNLCLDTLTKQSNCGPRTLQRLFRKHTHKTIRGYILDRKLQEAHLMLRSTNYSIGEIAGIIGYESVSTFIQMFKRKFQLTPGQVIKEYRN